MKIVPKCEWDTKKVLTLTSLLCLLLVQDTDARRPPLKASHEHCHHWKTLDGQRPKLYGHRGERALLPEHTIPSYKIAAILGADYVEPDLCLTKDNVFVCHHDLDLGSTTNVDSFPEFSTLRRNDSKWYIQDFTLQEIKKLRVKQRRMGIRPLDFDGFFTIPTFTEFVTVIHGINHRLNTSIGIIPELKNPGWHNSQADRKPFEMEALFLTQLRKLGYQVTANDTAGCRCHGHHIKCPPITIQTFEYQSLEYLRPRTSIPLMMLVMDDYKTLTKDFITKKLPGLANSLGIFKPYLHWPAPTVLSTKLGRAFNQSEVDLHGGWVNHTDYANLLHRNRMHLAVYTVPDSRESNGDCKSDDRGQDSCDGAKIKEAEMNYLFDYGVDGIFVENVAESKEMLVKYDYKARMASMRSGGIALAEVSFKLVCIALVIQTAGMISSL